MMNHEASTPLITPTDGAVTCVRWYIICVFALLSFMTADLVQTWVVIAQACVAAFGWTEAQVALMQICIYGPIILTQFPVTWWIHRKGVRSPLLYSAGLLFFASSLRCISNKPPTITWLAIIAHIAVGASTSPTFAAGPVISSVWFPANERTTATAIAVISGYIGSAGSFLFGPCLVQQPKIISTGRQSVNYTNVDEIKKEIMTIRYAECAVCGLLFTALLIYFPPRPPFAPTVSASMKKLDFKVGIRSLFSREKRDFWLVCIASTLPTGIYYVWVSLFNISLKTLGITESEAGWLGFVVIAIGCVSAVAFGRMADWLTGHMKMITLIMQTGVIIITFLFLLLKYGYIPYYKAILYGICILQSIFINATIPLCVEMAIENIFPVSEAITSSIMSFFYGVFPAVLAMIFLVPHIGTDWMNWVLYGCFIVSFPMVLLFNERYNRLTIDQHKADSNPVTYHSVIIEGAENNLSIRQEVA